jgi:rubredoxin
MGPSDVGGAASRDFRVQGISPKIHAHGGAGKETYFLLLSRVYYSSMHENKTETLGDQINTRVTLKCMSCMHLGEVELGPQVIRYGPHFPWQAWLRKLRCRSCGAKGSSWPTVFSNQPTVFRKRDER